MPPKKLTKKQQLEKELKELENETLQKMLVYDNNDKLLYEFTYLPKKTRVFKAYYENEDGRIVSKEVYEKLENKQNITFVEIEEGNGFLMEVMEYDRLGDDTSKIQINYPDD